MPHNIKTMLKQMTIYAAGVLGLLAALVSCGGGQAKQDNALNQYIANTQSVGRVVELIAGVAPTLKENFQQGDTVTIAYTRGADTSPLDSAVLFVRGERKGLIDEKWDYTLSPDERVGRVAYRVIAYQGADSTIRVGEFAVRPSDEPVRYGYRVVNSYPHDHTAYTQGLFWYDGYLYESTGQTGQSTFRKVDLETGEVLQSHKLEDKYFGEGAVVLGDKMYQLTWQHNRGFIYDAATLEPLGEFGYTGEGWGLTTDGEYLYMSDGTEKIAVYDPATFRKLRTIEVYGTEGRITQVNELEWIEGEIWANVYQSDVVLRIDPATGAVMGIVDLRRILPSADKDIHTDVLNGIAYDPDTGRIFVTGKNWKKLFEIEVVELN